MGLFREISLILSVVMVRESGPASTPQPRGADTTAQRGDYWIPSLLWSLARFRR